MLDYKKSRLDYGKILHPPEGFTLEQAVATTYSLDLTTFLTIPVALYYRETYDNKVADEQPAPNIFNAIQKTSESITIYCQKGKIKKPHSPNRLFRFLEESVIEVNVSSDNKSFHPKIWVVRFRSNNAQTLYRVIVLSRNLTFDRSWDISFYTEGFVKNSPFQHNEPLCDYLKHLTKQGTFKNAIKFISDLYKTEFITSPPFESLQFFPMGFAEYRNPLLSQKWKELIIVSPFLHAGTLDILRKNVKGKKYLFSRKEELDKLCSKALEDFITYSFSQSIVDAENVEELQEEADELTLQQNLHAKLYIGTDEKDYNLWYLGSANCSQPAIKENEEFLISLKSEDSRVSAANMLQSLLSVDKGYHIFEEYLNSEREAAPDTEYDFRSVVRKLMSFISDSSNYICEVSQVSHDIYDFSLSFAANNFEIPANLLIQFSPLGWQQDQAKFPEKGTFRKIQLYNLSPFIAWTITNTVTGDETEFLSKLDIELPKERTQAILKSIIENQERFLQLIQFILGGNDDTVYFKPGSKKKDSDGAGAHSHNIAMFEELLLASSRDKQKLIEIRSWMKKLKEHEMSNVVPEEFTKVWDVFQQVIPNE